MPIEIAESKCEKNKTKPSLMLLNIKPPTLPIKNIGEEVEQSALALTLSLSEITPFSFRSETIFAPTGYPDKRLIKKAYPTAPLTLKTFFVMGETTFEILLVIDSELKMEVIKKYGNKLGTTKASQSLIPSMVRTEKSLLNAKIIEK